MKWITRERPRIDRSPCSWLIERFIDQDTTFLYATTSKPSAAQNRAMVLACVSKAKPDFSCSLVLAWP